MCLSTPIAAGSEGNATTKSIVCANGSCLNNNNNNNNNNVCTLSAARCSESDDNANGVSIRNRICHKQKQCTINGKATATSVTNEEKEQSKELVDNLGYKEENAVYKEIPHTAESKEGLQIKASSEPEYNPQIRWPDLIAQIFLHGGSLYGIYLLFQANFYTFLWVIVNVWCSGIGITAGAHRLWSHKSYSASLPLRILLIFLFTIAGQRDAYTWALDHRIHHKFSETDADPHNANRGFFFAHVGWLFLTPHPKVIEKRKVIDMSDLENDKVVMFQRKYYIPLFALLSIALPVLVPCYFWKENWWISFWINFNLRFTCTLNAAFFVNSVAHMWGRKPYDKNISSVESRFVAFLALGEGWHNYHHVFPWDYKTGEFGSYKLNVTTAFIDFCAKIGWATGRKSVSPDMIKRRAAKCGDGSLFLTDEFAHKDQVWGFGDRDIPKEDANELAKMK
ncbi:acyl-CoA Delta-9 desaturase [Anastrepha obliqua]|uniref:acyl-CoA Delta-9 desaturase n=1 Tax=Anastrepha obliqua TaxID=95512 RepID=UPI00240A2D67|nr:acyl-CoA Delta-9 desaturase [Anastrepha obliqua]XP_054736884.1 acyl-CoA Delta-9 desaturase [Anastrepha obliqua]